MLEITVPIYTRDLNPRAKHQKLMGMNWYSHACNVFKVNGKRNTESALTKKLFNELIAQNKTAILAGVEEDLTQAGFGYHVHYDVYLGRKGSDGHNVRSVIEKYMLDALEEAGIIENDKFVYSTSSKFYLERDNPRCTLTITKLKEEHPFEVN